MTLNIESAIALSKELAKTKGLLPPHAQTAENILALILAGDELGFAPMSSLRSLQLISGKVTLTADAMLGLMLKAGISIHWEADGSDGVATLLLKRGDMNHRHSFTLDEAKQAGLLKNQVWGKFGPAMLRARAVSASVRAFAPDVLGGAYLPGELPGDARTEAPEGVEPPVAAKRAMPAAAVDAITLAAAQGFVPAAQNASLFSAMTVDLEVCTTRPQLAAWMAEVLRMESLSKADKAAAWSAFSTRCADLEMSPSELLAEAKGLVSE